MYPNLYYAIKDLFGLDLPGFKLIQSFGFFVAISFLLCAYFFAKDLKRKEIQGKLKPGTREVLRGGKASPAELFVSGALGFILVYKVLYVIMNFSMVSEDPQHYLLSFDGNIIGGILGAIVFAGYRYYEKETERKKYNLDVAKKFTEVFHVHEHVGNMTVIAAIGGLFGAKLFDILENFQSFLNNPWGTIFSFSGLTMYGGLIVGSAAVIFYAKRNGLTITHVIDACAPGLFLAYGVGRLGCQVAGDGDWGILNSAYIADASGKVHAASAEQFQSALESNKDFLTSQFGNMQNVQQAHFAGPSFLPDWMVAYTYPHNVIHEGVALDGCKDRFCSYLPMPVFPTPFYEAIICIVLFFVLWKLRKRIITPGVLFSVYLVLNGFERFFIELIRVNNKGTLFGIQVTQAEVIAITLFLLGCFGIYYFRKLEKKNLSANGS